MTNETKERIKAGLKLLFLPITGLHHLLDECKNDDYQNFHTEWFIYVFMVITWCGCIALGGISIWGLIHHFDVTIIPVGIVVGGIFVLFILPAIIHKLISRK